MTAWKAILAMLLALTFLGSAFAAATEDGAGEEENETEEEEVEVEEESEAETESEHDEAEEECVETEEEWENETYLSNGTLLKEKRKEKVKDCPGEADDEHEVEHELEYEEAETCDEDEVLNETSGDCDRLDGEGRGRGHGNDRVNATARENRRNATVAREDLGCEVTHARWREVSEDNGTYAETRYREKIKECADESENEYELETKTIVHGAGWHFASCVVDAIDPADCGYLRPSNATASATVVHDEDLNATSGRGRGNADSDGESRGRGRSAETAQVKIEYEEKNLGQTVKKTVLEAKVTMTKPIDALRNLFASWFGR